MTVVRRITSDDLHSVVVSLPDEMRNDAGGRNIGVSNSIIAHFLGRDWFAKHIRPDAPKRGFLNLDFTSDSRREASTFRVIELAENLFNLQEIEGFDNCINQMAGGGEKIESTCAELDFGRFLYIHDLNFRFDVPKMKKGDDFDFEVAYPDGLLVPADAKCKFETTAINPDSVVNSLKKARSQLPDHRPGIIFIKIPQSWINDIAVATAMIKMAEDFLRTTGRIASVKFFVSHLSIGNGVVLHRHAIREVTNRGCRFYQGRNWDMFRDYEVLESWNGMPPKWQRLFFVPKEKLE